MYKAAGISIPGRVDSLLKVSGIKHTCYVHQITLAVW